MSVAINSFLYRLPYDDIFGGVSAMMVEHFRQVCDLPNDTGQGVTFIIDAIIAFKQMSFIDQRVF